MTQHKQFKTYAEQVTLLRGRGMSFRDPADAETLLSSLNYYRLSAYWHPMRHFDQDSRAALDRFKEGTTFELVVDLYEFDERLRHCVFVELDRVETAMRSMLGYELGRIDPQIHLKPRKLGALASSKRKNNRTVYEVWNRKYNSALESSREDFVTHHKQKYGGTLPIWAAVEILDWGMLSHLFAMAPNIARNRVAHRCDLNGPQLASWLKSLNIVRNYAAHHARMFNRAYDIKPKLNDDPSLVAARSSMNRVFGQLSLIQYLHLNLGLSSAQTFPRLLEDYPDNALVPFRVLGAPEKWRTLTLWQA